MTACKDPIKELEHRKKIGEQRKKYFAEHPEAIKKMSDNRKGQTPWSKGKKLTLEHRRRVSESLTGKKHPQYGKHPSEETRRKLSESHKGVMIGEKNPQWGKHPSEETRRKMSEYQKTRPPKSEETRRKLSAALKGKKRSEEYCRKLSSSRMGVYVGDKNPNWRGGTSFEPYCIKFNREFRERCRSWFNHTCVECGTPQFALKRRLHIHHVNYDKDICCNDRKPLFVALCNSCNTKANADREYWEQHYTELIEGYYQGKCYFTKEEMKAYNSFK